MFKEYPPPAEAEAEDHTVYYIVGISVARDLPPLTRTRVRSTAPFFLFAYDYTWMPSNKKLGRRDSCFLRSPCVRRACCFSFFLSLSSLSFFLSLSLPFLSYTYRVLRIILLTGLYKLIGLFRDVL